MCIFLAATLFKKHTKLFKLTPIYKKIRGASKIIIHSPKLRASAKFKPGHNLLDSMLKIFLPPLFSPHRPKSKFAAHVIIKGVVNSAAHSR